MEQGRSVVWSQILQMRTPIEELCDSHPHLGAQLRAIWETLDHADSSKVNSQRRMEIASESEKLISHVRSLSGFERFLLPKKFEELREAARSGPIVILNASSLRCDALILASPSEIYHVPLEACPFEVLTSNQLMFRDTISGRAIQQKDVDRAFRPSPQSGTLTPDDVFRKVLGFLWTTVIEPCMNRIEYLQARYPYSFISEPMIINDLLVAIRKASSYTVVSHRSFRIPSHPCSWPIRSRWHGY